MADPATDAAIAERFPREWARANDKSLPNRSKARNQLRKRYAATVELEAFTARQPDARCANCAHSTLNPGFGGIKGRACDLDSDFYGYAMVRDDHVCLRWGAQIGGAA